MSETQNYTLGRGECHFGKFKKGTQVPMGERYFGNTPDLSYTASQENLDHYSSDRGVKTKDQSVVLQIDYTGQITTDHISPENLSIFFLGEASTATIAAATGLTDTFTDVVQGYSYQLGTSDGSPSGRRGVTNVVVAPTGTGTAYVAAKDYVVDLELGRVTVLEGGAITSAGFKVTYDQGAHSREVVISKSTSVEGSLRFIAKNPAGKLIDYFMPWVKITPNGDFTIKGDEWQQLPFNLEILKKGSLEAVYMDGRPFTG